MLLVPGLRSRATAWLFTPFGTLGLLHGSSTSKIVSHQRVSSTLGPAATACHRRGSGAPLLATGARQALF